MCHNWNLSSLNAYPATPDPIDWDYYKSKLSTKSALVDSFKKQVIYIFGKVICTKSSSQVDDLLVV